MMTEKVFHTENGNVFYYVGGNPSAKETLVFLPGLTADHTLFDKQIPYFEKQYRLVSWDAPAHGKSRPYSGFSYQKAADHLYAILEKELIREAVLIGQSAGGFTAQTLLKYHPEPIKAFVAIDSCPFGYGYYSRGDLWWLEQIEWMAALYPYGILKKALIKSCGRHPETRGNMAAALAPYSKKELCRLMGIGFAGFLTENCDLQINCPTFIIAGEHDRTGKVLQYCKEWNQKTGFPLYIVPNAAHNSNFDNDAAVNEAILCFLTALSLF